MQLSSASDEQLDERRDRCRRLIIEWERRRHLGEPLSEAEFAAQYPELMPELLNELDKLRRIGFALEQADDEVLARAMRRIAADESAHPGGALPMAHASSERRDRQSSGVSAADPKSTTAPRRDVSPPLPRAIGRYVVEAVIGEGAFGRVFSARDTELDRTVAIKVPHAFRLGNSQQAISYLAEARIVAGLDHPNIVPVYDAGHTPEGLCYVVSKLIRGTNLASRVRQARLAMPDATNIVLAVADALHYAHEHGLVHRDIKPANILLDESGRPFVADFGLARKDAEVGEGRSYAGTPAYMSPEQARGESHRVDRRSDVFSLGVVLYELLTGNRPFQCRDPDELLQQIIWQDPPPPRQLDAAIPEGLERICLKAMSKRAADRYSDALEMSDDLRFFLGNQGNHFVSSGQTDSSDNSDGLARPRCVMPKGLRAFDGNDAEYFLELIPGPRDREGLPEVIRSWKYRIETTDADESFPVGVLYGPSGCGKSSLVRAGLLPRLNSRVVRLYLEASAEETELRLSRRLTQQFPGVSSDLNLSDRLAAIRLGAGLAPNEKLLIVIDQFEQWLHGRGELERRGLVQSLRQCDGVRLQCLLLVRDDFWLALSRFMGELEVDLFQGRNTGLVDLFDMAHAHKVLVEFGRAYGRFADDGPGLPAGQAQFLKRAIAGLAQEERVVPVRLSLFAEMVKSRPWVPATLREIGGTAGVGVTFLEETFSARTANPRYLAHQRAAQAVLESLLPKPGSEIKGRVRSYTELLDISGYGHQPAAFRELMRILDSETRLLTPTDPEAFGAEHLPTTGGNRYFQLTHDFLVPSLREWLTSKQRMTRSGRLELRLAERSLMWQSHPERRQLPSAWEWLAIRIFTRPSQWTPPQRRMMRIAGRQHAFVLGTLLIVAVTFLLTGVELTAMARAMLMNLRARSAPLWLALGQEESVWPLLKVSPDPTLRTHVIHGLSAVIISPEELVEQLAAQEDPGVRRAMLLAAGELAGDETDRLTPRAELRYGDPSLPMIQRLLHLYGQDPDPGIRSSAEWTLRRLGHASQLARADGQAMSERFVGNRRWLVNRRGHAMVVIPGPTEYLMGTVSPATGQSSDESAHTRWIHGFCIASKETTAEQFRAFLADQPREFFEIPQLGREDANLPRTNITWFEAAAYCNWLSQQDGISRDEWCYLPNDRGKYAAGMRPAPDCLARRGYRLPTEGEWEYACRAGTETSRFFGDDPRQLPHFAVTALDLRDSPISVGSRKPNDFGLFDVLGNVAEWCHNVHRPYPVNDAFQVVSDSDDDHPASDTELRAVRGASYRDPASEVRSAARAKAQSAVRSPSIGFRVARGYP